MRTLQQEFDDLDIQVRERLSFIKFIMQLANANTVADMTAAACAARAQTADAVCTFEHQKTAREKHIDEMRQQLLAIEAERDELVRNHACAVQASHEKLSAIVMAEHQKLVEARASLAAVEADRARLTHDVEEVCGKLRVLTDEDIVRECFVLCIFLANFSHVYKQR